MDYPDGATPLDPDKMEGLKFKHISTRGELHKRLFGDVWKWAGSFRKTEKNIGVDPFQIAIQLRQLLDNTKYWVEYSTYPPKELAARFHHKLVYIHPFPNGNGRHARIIADVILTKLLNEPAIDWAGGYRLENMNDRRNEYIAALRAADRHDFSELLNFVGACE